MSWMRYINGNGIVSINLTDGTRIIQTNGDEEFAPDFPISLDINCSNKCDIGCPFCYQDCTPDGKHADLLNAKVIDELRPWTEVALQVPLDHPQLILFLEKLKEKNVIPSITVNQISFEKHLEEIRDLIDKKLIYGLGVSLVSPDEKFINEIKMFPNAVIHVINGVFEEDDFNILKDNDLKLLILGYKHKGRGITYNDNFFYDVAQRQTWLNMHIKEIISGFKVVSFDNLALEQLHLKIHLPEKMWEQFYQGDDGTISMYIDLVNGTFAMSSLIDKDKMITMRGTLEEMFTEIKKWDVR